MAAPFMGESPFPDPAGLPAMQPDAENPQEQGAPQEEPEQPQPGQEQGQQQHDPIDLEGAISDALETGCQLATAAVNPEDFLRFSQGVNQLAEAFARIQPSGDTADAQIAVAHVRANADIQTATIAAEAHRAAAANRPTDSQPSARG